MPRFPHEHKVAAALNRGKEDIVSFIHLVFSHAAQTEAIVDPDDAARAELVNALRGLATTAISTHEMNVLSLYGRIGLFFFEEGEADVVLRDRGRKEGLDRFQHAIFLVQNEWPGCPDPAQHTDLLEYADNAIEFTLKNLPEIRKVDDKYKVGDMDDVFNAYKTIAGSPPLTPTSPQSSRLKPGPT